MPESIERIARLSEKDIGPTEENVKQKVLVPILELLGHRREKLEFEHPTRGGGRIDIAIIDVPKDCKVIIDTKNYGENLSDHIEQIKAYTFDEAPLLTVIANGTEIRLYSLLRGIAFERSLLYSFQIKDLPDKQTWDKLSNLLHKDSLTSRQSIQRIEQREMEIKEAMSQEERYRQDYTSRVETIEAQIEQKEDEIETLRSEGQRIARELEGSISEIWRRLGLPSDVQTHSVIGGLTELQGSTSGRAGKVSFQELVSEGYVKDGQKLLLCYNGNVIGGEEAQIIAATNKLKYRTDGQFYGKTELAKMLLQKHDLIRTDAVRGPIYWKTEGGELLRDLEDKVRQKRGDWRGKAAV